VVGGRNVCVCVGVWRGPIVGVLPGGRMRHSLNQARPCLALGNAASSSNMLRTAALAVSQACSMSRTASCPLPL
jgi:hypothetical protein